MITANDFKNGIVIRWNNAMWQITSFQHKKMQQRAPIVRTKMVNLKTGAALEQAFRSAEKFEDVFLERKEIQYLYDDGGLLHFMDTSDYQDVVISREILGEQLRFLKDNDNVNGLYCDGELLSVELPASVTLKVIETEPGIRGDTAKSGTKPATVEGGAVIRVPLFVNIGDVLKIDTRTSDYLERS